MSDNAELHGKILAFLAGEFARKEGRQCTGVDLDFSPGGGFKDDSIRKWLRAEEPDLFDNFASVEKLVAQIIEIAEGDADSKPAGKHRFVVRTHQHMGGRASLSFAMSPRYNGGGDELALVGGGGGGGGRQDVIASHASQLMRINAQMFEGTIRVIGQQNMALHQQVATLTADLATVRSELDEARSNKMDREFQIAMAAEKNARINASFQKLLQIGTVVAAKIGGGEEGQGGGGGGGSGSPLAMLINEFGKSLRKEQGDALMNILDMSQKMMFMEIMNMVTPPEGGPPNGTQSGGSKPSGPTPSLPSSGPINSP